MKIHYYLYIGSLIIFLLIIWRLNAFSQRNKRNIAKYKPIIYPIVGARYYIIFSILLSSLTGMMIGYATIISENPLIFLPIGLISVFYFYYLIQRRQTIQYFLEDKIIFWDPSIKGDSFVEVDSQALEALVMLTGSRFTRWAININISGEKKSFPVDIALYNIESIRKYFIKNGKPIFEKTYYEKTAKQIN